MTDTGVGPVGPVGPVVGTDVTAIDGVATCITYDSLSVKRMGSGLNLRVFVLTGRSVIEKYSGAKPCVCLQFFLV